jgi:hypothetical protein
MASVIYIGPCDAVEVPVDLGGWQVVEKGGTLQTSDDHAAALLEQPSNWAPVSADKPKDEPKPKGESKKDEPKPDDGEEA